MVAKDDYTNADNAFRSLLDHATFEGNESQRCNRQPRRLKQITDRLRHKAAGFSARQSSNSQATSFRIRTEDKSTLTAIHNQMNVNTANAIGKEINPANAFEQDPLFELCKTLRRWDEGAKIPGPPRLHRPRLPRPRLPRPRRGHTAALCRHHSRCPAPPLSPVPS